MHRLAHELKHALESTGFSRLEICKRCHLEPAALSKYLNGKMHPRKKVLVKLKKVIPPQFLGKIYAAHLLDTLPEDCERYITIVNKMAPTQAPKLMEDQEVYHAGENLTQELEEAFSFLREMAAKSPEVAKSILSTYNIMRGVDLKKL
jgi:transcriptional regulator with XRE-family HTH domain